MRIVDIVVSGFGIYRRNLSLSFIPVARFFTYAVFGLLIASIFLFASLALVAVNPMALAALGVVALVFSALGFLIIKSFYSASMVGCANKAVSAQKITGQDIIEEGRRNWGRYLKTYLSLLSLVFPALALLVPGTALIALGQLSLGIAALVFTAGALTIASGALTIALIPLKYTLYFGRGSVKDQLMGSWGFVKSHPAPTAVLYISATLLTQALTGVASIFYGPPMVLGEVGAIIGILIGAPLLLIAYSVSESVTAIWWVKAVRETI